MVLVGGLRRGRRLTASILSTQQWLRTRGVTQLRTASFLTSNINSIFGSNNSFNSSAACGEHDTQHGPSFALTSLWRDSRKEGILGHYHFRVPSDSQGNTTAVTRDDIYNSDIICSEDIFHFSSAGSDPSGAIDVDLHSHEEPSSLAAGISAGLAVLNEAILYIKRQYQPSSLRRKRKLGFLRKVRSRNGRKILQRRRAKGRKNLTTA